MKNQKQPFCPKQARIDQIETALRKERPKLHIKAMEVELRDKEKNTRFPETHRDKTANMKLAVRQLKILVKHLDTELYRIKVFPLIENGKILKY